MENQLSTRFIQEALVGVKWKRTRLLRASQRSTSGVVWVEELSSTRCSSPLGNSRTIRRRKARNSWWRWRGWQGGTTPPGGVSGAGRRGQHRLRTVERLHLRLLVDAEDERALGRVEVEADDVDDLRDQLRVAAVLERARAVGLGAMLTPDAVHRRAGEPRLAREAANAPVRLAGGRRLERLSYHPPDHVLSDCAPPTPPGSIGATGGAG